MCCFKGELQGAVLWRIRVLRVAIISTPRSGNTWLRHLLSRLYQAATIPFHSPIEIEWNKLPADCILQLHWHPEPSFLAHLESGGFRVVVLARHPLDVLISILHFALTDQTLRWLEGEGGNERPIFGAMPRSTAFTDYATGPRAKALLAISHEWYVDSRLPYTLLMRILSLRLPPS